MRTIELSDTDVTRFWGWVAVAGPDDCWEWEGGKCRDGYGLYSVTNDCQYKAHRVACHLLHGTAGRMSCHTCDNPGCCNPAHLYPGTGKHNSRDRDKGFHIHGERCHLSKLTNAEVKAIAKLIRAGGTNREVADALGYKRRWVERIRSGESWGWLTGFGPAKPALPAPPVKALTPRLYKGICKRHEAGRLLRHAQRPGGKARGLPVATVLAIVADRRAGHPRKEVAARYGCSVYTVQAICNGRSRSKITGIRPD